MKDGSTATLKQKKDRRGLLALIGTGGAAAVAGLFSRNGRAAAGHGSVNYANNSGAPTVHAENSGIGVGIQGTGNIGGGVFGNSTGGIGVRGLSGSGTGVKGTGDFGVHGESTSNVGVRGHSSLGLCVKGTGKPGVYGMSTTGAGVKGNGKAGVHGTGNGAPGSMGVRASNNPSRLALRTEGRVQMNCARKVKLSNKDNLVTLPSGVNAASNAIVLAMVQGPPGNEAFVRRAFRVDSTHIRLQFDKAPASPTVVGYWVVHTA
jgi:hypothetical protein